MAKKPTDWRKRFTKAKLPHVVVLHTDFAGVKSGTTMLISSPSDIATYLTQIPKDETRTTAQLRNALAQNADAQSTCPVTTAIYLRVVAEVSLCDLEDGKQIDAVAPFWRVVTPDSKVAQKLSCGPEHVAQLIALDLGQTQS